MAVETKELLKFLNLGFTETELDNLDLDKVKEKFKSEYTLQSELNRKVGEMTGRLGTKYKQLLQENGVEFVSSDIEGKQFEDVLGLGITKFKTKYSSEIEDLKAKVGTGTGKQDEALLKKIEKLEQKEGEWSGKYSTLETEYNNYKTESGNQFKAYKLNEKLASEHANLPWAQGVTEVTKRGFFATVNDMVSKDLDETDNLIVKDKTGNLIPNPAVNNTFKTYKDILNEVGIKEGVFALNPHTSKQTPPPATPRQPSPTPSQPVNGRSRVVSDAAKQIAGI